ncbi:MAG: glycosyltransferase family 2 protein, partial [Cyanobacteria bacterium CRU_2_1]|nr:glycosyltransferase family 2 protein [Cyanobacteria bacterium CRU_2_1]
MKPLVSILIAAYNAEPWIAETLESALAQTWTNLEIIVVDDGSTDESLAIAKRYESRHVKVMSQPNQGASAARNVAYQACRGDYIQYLDADDLLAPDKIEQQVIHLKNAQDYVAAGQWGRFYQSVEDVAFVQEPLWNDFLPVEWLICSWMGGGMMHPAAWLLPRSIADLAGAWNESLSLNDDGEYFCRVVLASQGVKFCWGAKSYYRSGLGSSLSGAKSRSALESAFQSLELATQSLLTVENSQRTRQVSAAAFQRFVYSTYPKAMDLVMQAEDKVQFL